MARFLLRQAPVVKGERARRTIKAVRDADRHLRSLDADGPVVARVGQQLTGSGTAQSANYHAARRGRSRAEFIAKLDIAVEEADETEHWLIVIRDAHIISTAAGLRELDWLLDEAHQLRAILFASVRTARANHRNPQ